MLSLSPAKLLVILVVALLVLGPEKLPQVARQLGAAWHDLRRWRARLESEMRGTFPNLPPVHEVAQAVRSPFAFLDRLADEHERTTAENGSEIGSGDSTGDPAPDPPRDAVRGVVPPGPGPAPRGETPASTGTPAAVPAPSTSNGRRTAAASGSPGTPAVVPEGAAPVFGAAVPDVPDDPSMN